MVEGLPDLCRVCVLHDGRAKAIFSDNTILVTNSTGSAFLVIAADGRPTRQVSEYALARHSPLLAAVLEFRNMHVELPCYCKPLARVLRSSFTLGYLVQDATWSGASGAVDAGLASMQPDGKVVVSSEDGVAQVVLHSHRRRFAVCYPLLVAERPQDAQYEYVWQTQVYSVASHPQRWRPAIRAALLAAAQLEHAGGSIRATSSRQQEPHASSQNAPSSAVAMLLDLDAAAFKGSGQSPDPAATSGASSDFDELEASSARRSPLPRADECLRAGLSEQPKSEGWWGEPSLSLLPTDEVLLFEWTPSATYQFLPAVNEVEVTVHSDESCVVSTQGGRFLAHHRDPGAAEQLYAANCVPDAVWSSDKTLRYPLAPLAAHALKLRSFNISVTASVAARTPMRPLHQPAGQSPALGLGARPEAMSARSTTGVLTSASPDALFAALSSTVLEESSAEGQGRFTAYEDGRVRVCFEDRTILQLSSTHSHCKVMLPDGRAVVVATSNPVGVERYVAAAAEFAQWAFKTPAERSEELRLQARVRAEMHNSRRMAQLCDFSTTGALPGALKPEASSTLPAHAHVVSSPADHYTDRQAMIERLLTQNARLLERL